VGPRRKEGGRPKALINSTSGKGPFDKYDASSQRIKKIATFKKNEINTTKYY